MRTISLSTCVLLCLAACSSPPESAPIRLVDVFGEAMVEGAAARADPPLRTEWRFEDATGTGGFRAVAGVSGLSVRDGLLTGTTTSDASILHIERTTGLDSRDQLHSIELRIRVSAGTNLAIETSGAEDPSSPEVMSSLNAFEWGITTPILPGDEVKAYTLRSAQLRPANRIRHLFIRPSDVSGASFAIESIRLVFRSEYLASIESGVGFQGMSEIYRESLVSRAPETIRVPLSLPSRPLLDLAIGTVDDEPVTFRVSLGEELLWEQTVTTPYRWEHRVLDLGDHASRDEQLALTLASEQPGAIGVWGSPVIRQRLANADGTTPRGVIVLWTDTLRRDHLDAYGYERETAPTLRKMADEGVLFQKNISQATWTKVSTPSLMTSLYPSTHGVQDFPDYLPASAITLAEVYRDAGYATVSFASNLFTGQFTNLHQGFEEVHEDGSLPEVGSSKTSREYIDRFTRWLEEHRDVPFFAFVHLYDAHDPFEPRPPYATLWADPEKKEEHEAQLETVRGVMKEPLAIAFGMPSEEELREAGIDPDEYVSYDQDWYDGSIRGLDTEIERLFERLRQLGLDRKTLTVFVADHGEEFLDHGHTFHGQSVYGELTRVPLIFRWPTGIKGGAIVDELTRTIDVMPTLLELSGLEAPEIAQGQSFAPLLRGDGDGWRSRPAVSEKAATKAGQGAPWPEHTESYALVEGAFKLIHNRQRDDGTPEFELFNVDEDPRDQNDVAAEHPDVVSRMAEALEGWYEMANGARLAPDAESTDGMSQQQLERLRSLGYIR